MKIGTLKHCFLNFWNAVDIQKFKLRFIAVCLMKEGGADTFLMTAEICKFPEFFSLHSINLVINLNFDT